MVHLSMHEQAAGLETGDFLSTELTQALINRSARATGLGAWLAINEAGALASANAEAAQRRSAPLAGIPIAIKDNINTAGLVTTCASRILQGFVPRYDAHVIEKLREAGAVILGKANLDEFAMGSSTENSAYQPTKNPWDVSRIPGGSSGGSAAAVAAGLASAALGSDTGGSIRQPAAMCGIVGLKPTWGRVSRRGLIAFASSFDQIGPMARCVRDTALVYRAIAGHDPLDSTSAPRPVGDPLADLEAGVKGLTVGILDSGASDGVAPTIQEATARATQRLEAMGAKLVDISLPNAEYGVSVYYLIATAEAASNLARFDGVRYGHRADGDDHDLAQLYQHSRGEGFGREVKRRILLGTYALSAGYHDATYNRAQALRQALVADFASAFERCDLILSPTTPTTAFPLGAKTQNPLEMYLSDVFTIPANLAGLPSISIPGGLDEDGLPIGLQLTAPQWQEALLLRGARALEAGLSLGPFHPPETWLEEGLA